MRIFPLAVASFLLLLGCAGQGNKASSQEGKGVVFSVASDAFVLTHECTKSAELDHDEAGRSMVIWSMKRSPECSERAFDSIFSKAGQHLTIEYGDQVLVEDSLIVTPVDPASPTWLGVDSDEQAVEVIEALGQ